MCDVIKIRLKRREETRSKIRYKLHLKFGNPSFKIGSSTAVLAAGFLSHFSSQSFFLDIFLWRHTWHFPTLQILKRFRMDIYLFLCCCRTKSTSIIIQMFIIIVSNNRNKTKTWCIYLRDMNFHPPLSYLRIYISFGIVLQN